MVSLVQQQQRKVQNRKLCYYDWPILLLRLNHTMRKTNEKRKTKVTAQLSIFNDGSPNAMNFSHFVGVGGWNEVAFRVAQARRGKSTIERIALIKRRSFPPMNEFTEALVLLARSVGLPFHVGLPLKISPMYTFGSKKIPSIKKRRRKNRIEKERQSKL